MPTIDSARTTPNGSGTPYFTSGEAATANAVPQVDAINTVAGPPGPIGPEGPPGPEGPIGPQGLKGDIGNEGPIGPSGGPPGPEGPVGPQGIVGNEGPIGKPGASVSNATINNAYHLIFSISNSATSTTYTVDAGLLPSGPQGIAGPPGAKGDTGATGATGAQGIQGIQGLTGIQGMQGAKGDTGNIGAPGAQGPQGNTGVSVSNATINSSQHLIITLSNSSQIDAGLVPTAGAAGANGAQGNAGVSVSSATINSSSHLILTLSNSSQIDAGLIPSGPQGNTGVSIYGAFINSSSHLILNLSNSSQIDAGLIPSGPQGPQGPQGNAGVSVSNATINSSSRLILTLSNSTQIDAGLVASGSSSQNLSLNNSTIAAATINGNLGVSDLIANKYANRLVVEAQDYGIIIGSVAAAANNSIIINTLMSGISARGGGILQLPSGAIYIANTLDNKYPRVQVWGVGSESFHDSGSPTFGTRLIATTATTMLKLRTPYAAEQGVAVANTWKYTGSGFKFLYLNGGGVATSALIIDSVSLVDVDVFATNFNASVFYTIQCGVTGTNLGEACDVQFSKINLRARAIDYAADRAATICRLMGSANANVSLNRLPHHGISIYAQYWNGNMLTVDSADNNDISLVGIRAGGTGYLAYMKGPTSSIPVGGDGNTFNYVTGGGAIYAEGTNIAGVIAGVKNRIINFDNGNGTQEPTAGTGSSWAFTRATDNVQANAPSSRLAIADYANDAGSTFASMGSESLRIRNASSNHIRLINTDSATPPNIIHEWGINIDGSSGNLRFNRVSGSGVVEGLSSGGADTSLSNVLRTVNKVGINGATSVYATAQNPQTADGRKRIIAGRDFGLSLDGSTDDAPRLNDIIQKVGARGGGYIDIAPDLTAGNSAYMKTLSTIINNVPGVTVRGTHFANWAEFRNDPITNISGVVIVPDFDGIVCHHFTPFSNTAKQVTGGGFEYLTVWGGQGSIARSNQELLRVDCILRGSYIMNLMNTWGPTCAKFIARDPAFISGDSNTSIQYCNVDLYCRAGWYGNKDAHGVIMQTSEDFSNADRSGNVSHNRGWRIAFEGVNGKALWNRSGDANSGFSVLATQAGSPGVSELIWGSVGSLGQNGTHAMSFSGGTAIAGLSIVPPVGTFTVTGGKITDYTFTSRGANYDKTKAPPTVSFSACPGLVGASATCTIGVILYYADAAAKSKRSWLGGQSQGFEMLSGLNCPTILEGSNAPSAGALRVIDNGAYSAIFSGNVDSGNGTPFPIVGTQAFSSTRSMDYGMDQNPMALGAIFAGNQIGILRTINDRSTLAPFTSSSYYTGIAAQFLMDSNKLDLRLEDVSTGVIRLRDASTNPVLTKTIIESGLEIKPKIGITYDPSSNGSLTFEAVSNERVRIKLKGSDGVIRSGSVGLSQTGSYEINSSFSFPGATIQSGSIGAQGGSIVGAELGDFVLASCSFSLNNCTATGFVQAGNAVQVIFTNNTGSAVTLPAGTIYVRVLKR